jgi:hypothetical protein
MGDSRRFDTFAKEIAKHFPRCYKIGDIAGGKGYLQLALRDLGFEKVTTYDTRFDSRRVKNIDYRYQLFDNAVKEEFNLLVGMHPDEGTDQIIVNASRRHIPFMVVPCCIKPSAVQYWGSHKTKLWFEHLISLAYASGTKSVQVLKLPINGKNTVLFGKN